MPIEPRNHLPIHGFVLAGGKSSRMGRDKATLALHGKTLVEIALAKLREFCSEVSISGNRDDLQSLAPIVQENRRDSGPGAGIEACVQACQQPWALFIPVDVPLTPVALLQNWAQSTLNNAEIVGSTLQTRRGKEPAFLIAKAKECEPIVSRVLDKSERSLDAIYCAIREEYGASSLPVLDASAFAPDSSAEQVELWLSNINTPANLSTAAEANSQPNA